MKTKLHNYFELYVDNLLPSPENTVEAAILSEAKKVISSLKFRNYESFRNNRDISSNELLLYCVLRCALNGKGSLFYDKMMKEVAIVFGWKTNTYRGWSLDEELSKDACHKITAEKGYFGQDGFSDLEMALIEKQFSKELKEKKIENPSILFDLLIRNPITDADFLKYLQDGIKELSFDKSLKNKISATRIYRNGITTKSLMDSPKSFAKSIMSFKRVGQILQSTKSGILKDIGQNLLDFSSLEYICDAERISKKRKHMIEVDLLSGENRYREVNLNVSYVDGKKRTPLFGVVYGSKDDDTVAENYKLPIAKKIMGLITDVEGEDKKFLNLNDAMISIEFLKYAMEMSEWKYFFKKKGIPHSFPEIRNGKKSEIDFEKSYNPALLFIKKKEEVIPNSIHLNSAPQMYLISGLNAGGKTTLLKQVGQLAVLAQMGGPIPATYSSIIPSERIYTHFHKKESLVDGESRFTNELTRLANILSNANRKSIILLDEPISGTSIEDAFQISKDIIYGLLEIGGPIAYTTHIHKLQEMVQSTKLDKICSNMKADFSLKEGKIRYSYRIVPGIAEKSYGIEKARELLPVSEIIASRTMK